MPKTLLIALAIVLTSVGFASAQGAVNLGDYDMEWSILHTPVSSDQPDLQTGTSFIRVQDATTAGGCPPTSAYVVFDAPAFAISGVGTTTWCIKSDGTFDTSASGNGGGSWLKYTASIAIIEAENRRGNDVINAVARRREPNTLKVFITQPRASATVSGTAWTTIWVEGTSGSANIFVLSVDGKVIASQNAGSSRGPVTFPWNTKTGANGAHTLKAEVGDATGNTGSTSITVIVNNP
jgi:hypothetical protein